jgi:hypothetical protein
MTNPVVPKVRCANCGTLIDFDPLLAEDGFEADEQVCDQCCCQLAGCCGACDGPCIGAAWPDGVEPPGQIVWRRTDVKWSGQDES